MLDELDAKIITRLLEDARTTLSSIAKECGVSATAIHKRYEQLKDAGIIVGSTVILDFSALDYECWANFFVHINPKQLAEFTAYVNKFKPGLHFDPIRKYNMHIFLPVKDLGQIDELKELIRRHPSVFEIKTSIWKNRKDTPENLNITCT